MNPTVFPSASTSFRKGFIMKSRLRQAAFPHRVGHAVEVLEQRRLLAADFGAIATLVDARLSTINANLQNVNPDVKLPVIGQSFGDIDEKSSFIPTFQPKLKSAIAGITAGTPAAIRAAVLAALGPASGGANVLADADKSGVVDGNDITATPGSGDNVSISFRLYGGAAKDIGEVPLDTALPLLPLTIDADQSAQVDRTIQFAFQNFTFGWQNGAAVFGGGSPMVFNINVNGQLGDGDVVGTIGGFLPYSTSNGGTAEGDTATATLDAEFAMTVNAAGDYTKATLGGTGGAIDLRLHTDIGEVPTIGAPQISTQFALKWAFGGGGDFSANAAKIGSKPTVVYDHVQIDLGSLVDKTIKPILQDVLTATKPLQPVLDVLNTPLPVISDLSEGLGGGTITLLSLAKAASSLGALPPNIAAIVQIVAAVDSINKGANALGAITGGIELGSFDLSDYDLREVAASDGAAGDDEEPLSPHTIQNLKDQVKQKLDDLGLSKLVPPELLGNNVAYVDLTFPVFDDPTRLFGVLLGQDASFVDFEAKAVAETGITNVYPFGPVNIGFGGKASINFFLKIGYDTYGVRALVESGNPTDLFQGFYVDDRSIAAFTGTLTASAALTAAVFSVGIEGGVGLTMSLKPHTVPQNGDDAQPDNDEHKIRPADFQGTIFDTSGAISGALSLFIKIGVDVPLVGFVGYTKSKEIVGGTIFEFSTGGVPDPFAPPPVLNLGYVDTNGLLHLAVGADANVLEPATLDDATDTIGYTVVAADKPGTVALNAPHSVYVTAFGYTQLFEGVKGVVAGSDPNKKLNVSVGKGVDVPVVLNGGGLDDKFSVAGDGNVVFGGQGGDDQLRYTGSGRALMYGFSGNDQLYGGSGENELYGEGGDDLLTVLPHTGPVGLNTLKGNNGDDTIQGGLGSVNLLAGGPGSDLITAGDYTDAVFGDYLPGELLRGQPDLGGNDTITAGEGRDPIPGDKNIATTVFGGSGDDLLNFDGAKNKLAAFDGESGFDSVAVLGTNAGETFTVAGQNANDLYGNPAYIIGVGVATNVGVSFTHVESLDLEGLGGADIIGIPNLQNSDLQSVGVDLQDVLQKDNAVDKVTFAGTGGNDGGQVFNEGVAIREYITTDSSGRPIAAYDFGGITKVSGLNNYQMRVGNVQDAVKLDAGGGNDNLLVYGHSGNTTVLGGSGNDSIGVAQYQKFSPIPDDADLPPKPGQTPGLTFNGTLNLDAGIGTNKFAFGDFNADDANVTLKGNVGTSEITPNGVTFLASGGNFGGGAAVYTGPGNDNVKILSTIADAPTLVSTDDGLDKVVVLSTDTLAKSTVNGLKNTLDVDVGDDFNQLTLEDAGSTSGNTDVRINATTVSGLAAFNINYSLGNDSSLNIQIEGSDSTASAEKFTLDNPNASVRIDGNGGNDTLSVAAIKQSVQFFGLDGADTLNVYRTTQPGLNFLDRVKSGITFTGGNGTDRIFISDSGDTTDRAFNVTANKIGLFGGGAVYQTPSVESAQLIAGLGGDQFNVDGVLPEAFAFSFYGNGGFNGMKGPAIDSYWKLTGKNQGTLNTNVAFFAVGVVQQDAGTNIYSIANGVASNTIIDDNGNGTLDYADWATPVTVDMNIGAATGTKYAVGIRNAIGGKAGDLLRGTSIANALSGGGGNDVLVGLDGGDTLVGNGGDDIVIGGNGADGISGNGGVDLLIDGTTSSDKNDANLVKARTQWTTPVKDPILVRFRPLPAVFQGTNKLSHDAFVDTLAGNDGNDDFYASVNATRVTPKDVLVDKTSNDLLLT